MHLTKGRRADAAEARFDVAMAALGPFEAGASLAVAVSGGPDSMALALLAAGWARPRRATVLALTVDHRLRPESGSEARQVGRWLKAHGLGHRVLAWDGPHPSTGIQAAARAARYGLLTGYCRQRGILHLLLGHQREDQAETVMMRQAAGSGPDGLAGMAALVERDGVRLLRPLLDVPRVALFQVLAARRQAFIEDPSNASERFLRPRLRRNADDQQRDKAVVLAHRSGRRRAAAELSVARLMVSAVRLTPAGVAFVDPVALMVGGDDEVARVLGGVIATIGGATYRPAPQALSRLVTWLRAGGAGQGRTLGGCRLLAHRGELIVFREAAAVAGPGVMAGPAGLLWDGRFRCEPTSRRQSPALTVRALCETSLAALRRSDAAGASAVAAVIAPARAGLPRIEGLDGFLTVPHLDWQGTRALPAAGTGWRVRLQPIRPLLEAPFLPSQVARRVATAGISGV